MFVLTPISMYFVNKFNNKTMLNHTSGYMKIFIKHLDDYACMKKSILTVQLNAGSNSIHR